MSQKNNSSVVLFFIICAAVVLSVFVMNIGRIKQVLEQTNFVESVLAGDPKKEAAAEPKPVKKKDDSPALDFSVIKETPEAQSAPRPLQSTTSPAIDITSVTETTGDEGSPSATLVEPLSPTAAGSMAELAAAAQAQQRGEGAASAGSAGEAVPQQGAAASSAKGETPPDDDDDPVMSIQLTQVNLCFMNIDSGGNLIRKECERSVPASDSPLTVAVKTLLNGPNADEENKGCMSLIPQDSKLLSAAVKNRVAYLSFNDAFQWNKYGVEGYFGQLMQIVYTATTFPTVDSVQFLIEGEKQDYLGSEGVWIGSPLSRGSF